MASLRRTEIAGECDTFLEIYRKLISFGFVLLSFSDKFNYPLRTKE